MFNKTKNTKKPIVVCKQQIDTGSFEHFIDPIARFDNVEDAKRLIEAKQIAHDLERKASNRHNKYRFFAVNEFKIDGLETTTILDD